MQLLNVCFISCTPVLFICVSSFTPIDLLSCSCCRHLLLLQYSLLHACFPFHTPAIGTYFSSDTPVVHIRSPPIHLLCTPVSPSLHLLYSQLPVASYWMYLVFCSCIYCCYSMLGFLFAELFAMGFMLDFACFVDIMMCCHLLRGTNNTSP